MLSSQEKGHDPHHLVHLVTDGYSCTKLKFYLYFGLGALKIESSKSRCTETDLFTPEVYWAILFVLGLRQETLKT